MTLGILTRAFTTLKPPVLVGAAASRPASGSRLPASCCGDAIKLGARASSAEPAGAHLPSGAKAYCKVPPASASRAAPNTTMAPATGPVDADGVAEKRVEAYLPYFFFAYAYSG